MKRIALILALLPGTAMADDWWQGIWAWDTAWCAVADQIGSVTPAPIAITSDEVLGYENSCGIATTREITESVVLLGLTCSSEGETYEDERLVMRGESSIWMWYGADEPVQFNSCN